MITYGLPPTDRLSGADPLSPTPDKDTQFCEFYELYPKKTHRVDAFKAWIKLDNVPEFHRKIMTALSAQIANNWRGIEQRFIPDPSTWLNGQRWNDAVISPNQKTKPPPQTAADKNAKWLAVNEKYTNNPPFGAK